MIYIALLLLLFAAALALALSRVVPTRWLGLLVALLTLSAGAVLFTPDRFVPLELLRMGRTWVSFEGTTIGLSLGLGPVERALGLTMLGGGALLLATLALALTSTVRGFGSLFAWSVLALAAGLAGLGTNGLLVPLAWSLTALLGYSAIRASGTLQASDQFPRLVGSGLLAGLLLLGCTLFRPFISTPDTPATAIVITVLLLACLLFVGAAPFHAALDEATRAPAALGSMMYGVLLPLLGLHTLASFLNGLRIDMQATSLPVVWQTLLLGFGLLGVVGCAAGALREHSLKRLLAWQAGFQAGSILLCYGLDSALASLAATALLLNLALTTSIGAVVIAIIERQTGSDDYVQNAAVDDGQGVVRQTGRLHFPALLWLLVTASAIGLPGVLGFWGRYWFAQVALEAAPWLLPPLLLGSVLLLLALLSPLGWMWQTDDPRRRSGPPAVRPFLPVALLAVLPLPVLGMWPVPVWHSWRPPLPPTLQSVSVGGDPIALPVQSVTIAAFVLGVGLLVVLWGRRPQRQSLPDEDMIPVALAPDELAGSLGTLTLLADATPLLRGGWQLLIGMGNALRSMMTIFEQRYYLVGVVLAMISLILLMAQT